MSSQWTRRLAGVAVGLIGLSEFYTLHRVANILSTGGIVLLLIVSVSVGLTSLRMRRMNETALPPSSSWKIPYLSTAFVGAFFVQFWFRWGKVLAGGDVSPPLGTAWVGRIFSSYGWTGDDLGGAVMNQVRLPWGVFELTIHWLGGSAAFAQRLWLTVIVVLLLLSTMWFAKAIYLSPVTASVAGLFYVVSPYTAGVVSYNDVYLIAMTLIPYCATLILLYVRGTLPLSRFVIGWVVAAPFFGYAYINPPLVGLIVAVVIATLLLVIAFAGWRRVVRRATGLISGFVGLGVASLYWIIPSFNSLSLVSTGNLSGVSTWSWTEHRATLPNALWLNTVWTWNFNTYNPVASAFTHFPLEWIPILLPIVVFGVFMLKSERVASTTWVVVSFSFIVSLLIIVLSTGTRYPMGPLFSVLYNLPYGWLIREPGRFLMVAALGYALIIGVVVDIAYSKLREHLHTGSVGATPSSRISRALPHPTVRSFFVAELVTLVILGTGYPVWSGAFVPLSRPGFPSTRVTVPPYWTQMVDFINSSRAPSGSLLALPADDFYQMPYTWYYGTDGFIVDSLARHVLVPSTQGYTGASPQLVGAVDAVDAALLSHRWTEATAILQALGTPMILVRGDVLTNLLGRSIANPTLLAQALRQDPQVRGLRQYGSLTLFELRGGMTQVWRDFVTTSSAKPPIGVMRFLQSGQTVVSGVTLPGVPEVTALPSFDEWSVTGAGLQTYVAVAPGSRNHVVTPTGFTAPNVRIGEASSPNQNVAVTLPWTSQDLASATKPVNCVTPSTGAPKNNLVSASSGVRAGTNVLRVTASAKVGCMASTFVGPARNYEISYESRQVSGPPGLLCVLQLPSGSCSTIAWRTVGLSGGWIQHQGMVAPLAVTTSLRWFFETGLPLTKSGSVIEFRNVESSPLPLVPVALESVLPGVSGQWQATRLSQYSAPPPIGMTSPLGRVVSLAGLATVVVRQR